MAKGGVLTQRITCTMHTGTHCDAPRHVMEYEFDGQRGISALNGCDKSTTTFAILLTLLDY